MRIAPAAAATVLATLLAFTSNASAGEDSLTETGSPRAAERVAGDELTLGQRCKPSIELSAATVLAGETVTVSGVLQCPEETEAPGQTVTLYAHSSSEAQGFAAVGSATVEADGSFAITSPVLEANTVFYVQGMRKHSPRRRVRVTPEVSLVAPPDGTELAPGDRAAGVAPTNTVTFTGVVAPASASDLVVLERERPQGSGRWLRIAITRVDESGRYSITHTFRRPGEATVRVLVRSPGRLALAASAPVTYMIAARLRPARQARVKLGAADRAARRSRRVPR
jgi:hypothetical protein